MEYFKQSFLMPTNQDFEESGSDAKIVDAVLNKMLLGSLEIIPNKDSCLLWMCASMGTVPARK